MAAGSAGEGAGSNTELRWRRNSRLACQSEMALALAVALARSGQCEAVTYSLPVAGTWFKGMSLKIQNRALPCDWALGMLVPTFR